MRHALPPATGEPHKPLWAQPPACGHSLVGPPARRRAALHVRLPACPRTTHALPLQVHDVLDGVWAGCIPMLQRDECAPALPRSAACPLARPQLWSPDSTAGSASTPIIGAQQAQVRLSGRRHAGVHGQHKVERRAAGGGAGGQQVQDLPSPRDRRSIASSGLRMDATCEGGTGLLRRALILGQLSQPGGLSCAPPLATTQSPSPRGGAQRPHGLSCRLL